jgi:beta-galactosidase/beta-glucuronidase
MSKLRHVLLAACVVATGAVPGEAGTESVVTTLPPGVKAVWDLAKAFRETTPTRERICINGLWRWQPAGKKAEVVPADRWGYFKVPGQWPRFSDYMQEDTQVVYPHPSWKCQNVAGVTSAWYQREISVPPEWAGRRIKLDVQYLNSYADVYVDARKAGEIRFPAGELDLTSACPAGTRHVLTMLVAALPLSAVQMSFSDTNAAKEVRGSVARRGLCGDVYLASAPRAARISDVRIDTSVRKWAITFNAGLEGLAADARYTLHAQISDAGRAVAEFTSPPLRAVDLKDGRAAFFGNWKPEKLWDIITPENQYQVTLSLRDAGGQVFDVAYPERFGFREFWIDGRDFYLNLLLELLHQLHAHPGNG